MSVLLIAGSPSPTSRSAALLECVGQRLARHHADVRRLQIRELNARAMLQADFADPSIARAARQVAEAQVVIVATPIYKAAYSGVLKLFLDLLPQTGLKGKTVLPLATGGSPHHMLALDYALRPVLQALGARQVLAGIYATDAQVCVLPEGASTLAPELALRVDEAVRVLAGEVLRVGTPVVTGQAVSARRPANDLGVESAEVSIAKL
ncbi:NADPH-dependent FMN reductase [Comamonas endophytica]|uniref:NADPH-dependent FMN reductase n=1 Tax=Comamonas endophytica TaxID=2949090 RepID=A0ABY6GB09_9BURK|nr:MULTISPECIES: NADPH-dependent FMN reductase [unclassified Acidovorax]MCD2513739.1 NADPH-dependent FMN reductase [Acidovorax sp. D4N7]UYG52256.1 NADPH-dependent FMN reductase [Acidovorax sp. 5MLIR]